MSIMFQPTRSNVDLRGASLANSSALDSFNRAIAGLRGNFEGIDNARNDQALNTFQNQIGNLSADELSNFDVGAQAGNSRLNRSILDNVLNKRLASVRAQEEAGFKAAEFERQRKENPLMQNILSELNGKSSTEQQAILQNSLANLPGEVSGKFKNDLFAAAQNRIQNTLNNERANTQFTQQQADRQKNLAAQQRMSAAENFGANILSNLGVEDNEDSALAALRGSGEYAQLDARERNQAEDFLRSSYRKRTQLSPEAQKVLDKTDNLRQTAARVQLQELNNQRQSLGNRPEIKMSAADPKSRNEALSKITKLANSLDDGHTFGANNLTGRGIIKEAENIMTNGFTLEGVKYKPEDIDGEYLINAIDALHERDNILFDESLDKDQLHLAIANSINATKRSQAIYDAKAQELDKKFRDHEFGILQLNEIAPEQPTNTVGSISDKLAAEIKKRQERRHQQ